MTVILATLALAAPEASGQGRAGAAAWGFVTARYDARSASSIHTGYGWGPAFGMAGVVHHPRSGDTELIGGAGVAFRTGARAEHWIALATARSGETHLAQVYWLPRARLGVVTARATVKGEFPGGRGEPRGLGVSPLALTFPLARRLAGGLAADIAAADGARATTRAGVQLRLGLAGAVVGADALRDLRGDGSRLRLHFASTFR